MVGVHSSASTTRERIHAPVENYLLWRMIIILALVSSFIASQKISVHKTKQVEGEPFRLTALQSKLLH